MTLSTVGDLVTSALRVVGVTALGQTPAAEDITAGFDQLQLMLGQWRRDRALVPLLGDASVVTTGAASYAVGVGLDINTPRTDRINAAFVRYLQGAGAAPLDVGLAVISSRETWNGIGLKTLVGPPSAVWYEASYPTAYLHVWPVPPAAQYEIHIATKSGLPTYVGLTDSLGVSAEYLEAMLWGLVIRVAMAYGQEPRPSAVGMYRQALQTLRTANEGLTPLDLRGLPGVGGRGGLAASVDPGFLTGWTV